MTNLSKERREKRFLATDGQIMSRRQYNIALCGTLLYGLLINFLICARYGDTAARVNPLVFFVGYFVCALAGCMMSAWSHNPVVSFIGYNLVVVPSGFIVSMAVQEYGGLGSEAVTQAFLITLLVTAAMTLLAVASPEFCSRIGSVLFGALIGLIIAEVILMLIGRANIAISWISAAIFSMYIAYDVWRSQQFPPTMDNAIDSALDIYLDIINLFIDLLEIFGNKSSKD